MATFDPVPGSHPVYLTEKIPQSRQSHCVILYNLRIETIKNVFYITPDTLVQRIFIVEFNLRTKFFLAHAQIVGKKTTKE